jgi:hypothetical protein
MFHFKEKEEGLQEISWDPSSRLPPLYVLHTRERSQG